MKRKVVSPWRRLRVKYPHWFGEGVREIGNARDWFLSGQLLPQGAKIVLYCRVSSGPQANNGNLKDQIGSVRKWASSLGLEVVAVYREASSGWVRNRSELTAAARRAKSEGAVLLAETPCRYIRSEDYNSVSNCKAQPSVAEYRCLVEEALSVPLYTVSEPSGDLGQMRSLQTKRGQVAKGNCGGRPLDARTKRLRIDEMIKNGEDCDAIIAMEVGCDRTTVWRRRKSLA